MPNSSDFAGRTFNIVDYGAVGDGKTLCTVAIQKTIAACAGGGGGRVEVPAGHFLSGPIELANDVDFHLDGGAILLFSRDYDQYPLVYASFLGKDTVQCTSPITARNLRNVCITGPGTIDGQGEAWRPLKKNKVTADFWNSVIKGGGITNAKKDEWWPTQAARDGEADLDKLRKSDDPPKMEDYRRYRDLLRPDMVALIDCQNLLIDGPTFRNSPFWAVQVLRCRNVVIRNSTIYNELWAQNGDGVGFDSSRDILMENCTVYAGDDNIVLKSGKGPVARQRHLPTQDVVICHCTSMWGHGGFVLGSETSGDIRNIRIIDCSCIGTDIGLRFKSIRGRGGVVENVRVEHMRMSGIKTQAILFDMYYELSNSPDDYYVQANSPLEPLSERTPCFRKFDLRDIICDSADQSILINGLPELPISDVRFENMQLTANRGAMLLQAKDITLENVEIKSHSSPAFSTDHVSDLNLKHFMATTVK